MAVTQEELLRQPPEAAQPGQAPNAASGTQPASSSQAPSPAMQAPAGTAAQGQAPSSELDFSQLLEQQIAQAIQPVLDEFRQNVAQVMEQQTAPVLSPATSTDGAGTWQGTAQGQGIQQQPVQQQPVQQQPVQQQGAPSVAQQPVAQQPLGQSTQQAQTQQAQAQPLQQAQQQMQPTESAGPSSGQPESRDQQGLQGPVTGALQPALQAVERHGEQWLQSVLVAGLTALLTESTHAAIQQRAEHGLHTLLQKLFEAVPDGVSNQEMLDKTERTLQAILRESLDAIFAGGMRTTVQQGGQQAIQESLHGNFGGALRRVEDTLKAMVEALLAVLRRQWQNVLRLLLALVLLALESSLAQSSASK